MSWPFRTISQNSDWPFHGLLVSLAGTVLSAPTARTRALFARKQIERCVRLGAKLAVEFDFPPDQFVRLAYVQIVREGGPRAAATLQALAPDPHPDTEVEGSSTLVDFLEQQIISKPDTTTEH